MTLMLAIPGPHVIIAWQVLLVVTYLLTCSTGLLTDLPGRSPARLTWTPLLTHDILTCYDIHIYSLLT